MQDKLYDTLTDIAKTENKSVSSVIRNKLKKQLKDDNYSVN